MRTIYYKKRKQKDLSRIDVANYLGIDYQRYCMIEEGDVKMPTRLIDKFNEILNKSDGELKINKLNREQEIDKWWKEVSVKRDSVKRERGNFVLHDYMNKFNIKSLNELQMLLGYSQASGNLSHYLNNPDKTPYNFKNRIYTFFEDELNIQPIKKKNKKKTKNINKSDLYEWYNNFDLDTWFINIKKEKTINDIVKESNMAYNTLYGAVNRKSVSATTIAKLKYYVDNSNISIVKETTPIIKAEKIVNKKPNDFTTKIIDKYTKEIENVDKDIINMKKEIECYYTLIRTKETEIKEYENKKEIYNEFIKTLENGE